MPTHLPTLRRQAEAAFAAGDFGAVDAACRQLLALKPDDSLAHYLLSALATSTDKHRRAVHHALAAAADLVGSSVEHASAVGLKLISVGEYGTAFNVLTALTARQERLSIPALTAISRQFGILEHHRLSLDVLERAERQGAKDERSHYLIGNAVKFLGDIDGAAARYETCLRINPAFAYAHWSLAYLGKRYNRPEHAARIRAQLASSRASDSERIVLNYALFKELDAAGDHEGAWSALSVGSALKNRQVTYRAEDESALYDAIMRTPFAPTAARGEANPSGPRPIFIVGLPRTGTTLLERILSNNPSVAICGELNDLRLQFKWCTDHFSTGFFDSTSIARIPGVDPAELGARYLDHVRWRLGDNATFTDKNPGNFMMIGAILSALPDARILHLRRDPTDSCFSNLKELFAANIHPYSYSLDNLASHHANYSRLMAHWHALAPSRILDVHYETLVSDPSSVASEVMRFCGLGFEPGYVNIEDSQRPVSTASSAQVREPIHSRFVGAWKNYAGPLAGLQARLAMQATTD